MTETPKEFLERYPKEHAEALEKQKQFLNWLIARERICYVAEDENLPPENVFIQVSSDLAKLWKESK